MKVVIIGGAGFIGCNAAEYYVKKGVEVVVFDNLSRKGSEENLNYLLKQYKIKFVKGDITIPGDVKKLLSPEMVDASLILHLAAQVTVTTSVTNPREDFNINALGTFNVLESLREIKEEEGKTPVLIYASTNKVYGSMEDVSVIEKEGRYDYENLKEGISEERLLDFHSPYGCSKGCGDQYVRDYHRIFGLNTIVMRQSCVYGRRQFGVEDQGWVAWFTIANILDKPITIFGDGKQVRDVLWIDDLIEAFDLAFENINITKGQCYNIGGGRYNKMSLHELIKILQTVSKKEMDVSYSDWRAGDQKVCFMNIDKAKKDFGWSPKVEVLDGIKRLYKETEINKKEIEGLFK